MRTLSVILLLLSIASNAQDLPYSDEVINHYDSGIEAYTVGDNDLATHHFETCISIDSTCFEAYIGLAQISYTAENYTWALTYCEEAAEWNPFDPLLSSLMGRCYFKTGNYSKAELLLKRAISTGDQSDHNIMELINVLNAQGKYEQALHYHNQLVSKSPNNLAYLLNRGLLYFEIENYEKAKTDFLNALELDNSNPLVYLNLANAYFATNHSEKALSYIDSGLSCSQENERIELLLLKGRYYHALDDYENAQKFYQKAAEINAHNSLILTCEAAVLIDLEDYETAAKKCTAALEIDPELMQAYFNRGIANEMLRRIDEACNDWQRAFILGSQEAIEYLNGPICNE